MLRKHKQKPDKLTVAIRILTALIIIAVTFLLVRIAIRYIMIDSYPQRYNESVYKYAEEYDVDPFLIFAIIKTESGFNSQAVSNVGARGLMQIMPDTFEWIRWKWFPEDMEDENGLDFDDMFVPDHNIRYGVRLIAYHLHYYENMENSLAAYHAGDANVDKWLKDESFSSDGKTLNKIPIPETAHYVRKVTRAYEKYLELYTT
ncbi:MAG: lytic transglycosylase domain-containing protein [Oscillospiraceae bacterium]|nr:lytic transglycosylase domain-containing protein [Oscillospiraceae bacterium]